MYTGLLKLRTDDSATAWHEHEAQRNANGTAVNCSWEKVRSGAWRSKIKNMPHHKARSGAWRRKIKKYAPLQSQKRGMEKENYKICPITKLDAGRKE